MYSQLPNVVQSHVLVNVVSEMVPGSNLYIESHLQSVQNYMHGTLYSS